jgi:hypothetical protein
VGDPHRAIDRGAAQIALALRDDAPGLPAAQRVFRVGVEQPAGHAERCVGEAGEAVGGAELAQHRRRVVARQSMRRSSCFISGRSAAAAGFA